MLRVVAPAASLALTSEPRARDHLRIGVSDVPSPYLRDLIASASAAIAQHCRDPFVRQDYQETFRPDGGAVLVLSRGPALPDTLKVDGEPLDADAIDFDPVCWHLRQASGAGWGRRVVVAYTAGWVAPDATDYGTTPAGERLPADIEQACLTIIQARIAGRDRDPMLRSSATEGAGADSWIASAEMGGIPPQAIALLQPYRRIGSG